MSKNEIQSVMKATSFERDSSFDILKGLGIILMIWVHCKTPAISQFAYTFHMPLFLFISGYFYKRRIFKQELSLDIQRIIVPYLFTCFVMIVLAYIFFDNFSLKFMTKTAMLSSLWGGAVFGSLSTFTERLFIGPLWFLLGLFWTRLIFCTMLRFIKSDLICGSIIFVLAITAKCIFEVFGHVPLSILQAFGCSGFFYMGFIAKKYDLLNTEKIKKTFPVCALCWLYCMTFSSLALHKCTYDGFYILDILGAWAIFCILYILVKTYVQSNWFWNVVLFAGRNSIVVLCVHAIDHCMLNRWSIVDTQLSFFIGDVFFTFFRLSIAIFLAYLLTKNKFIYEKIFCMKKR